MVDRLQLAEVLSALFAFKQGFKCDPNEIVHHWTVPAMRAKINELSTLPDRKA